MPLHPKRPTRARDVLELRKTLFFWLLPAWVALGACRQGDDIVATLPDSGFPPIEDATIPPVVDVSVVDVSVDVSVVDVSVERDAPLITIDREVPQPDAVVIDNFVPPPPMDASSGCAATGPIISVRRVNNMSSEECAGQLAAHAFTHAVCACGDLNIAAVFQTGSLDSSATPKVVVQSGAAVGIAGSYPTVGSHIGGTLTVAGTDRMPAIYNPLLVDGDLRLAGGATILSQLTARRHVWLVSRLGYLGYVTITGNLYTAPPNGTLLGPPNPAPVISGSRIPLSFTVDDPCGCSERLDIATMEMIGAVPNDNAAHSIDPSVLSNVTISANLLLNCGRFRFDSIGGTGPIQLTVSGRTAIFVDGNVNASDVFQLVLAPDAEVDWFIRGNLSISNAKIGDPARPSATRIYVAGTDNDLALSGGQIAANIYAPNTNVNLSTSVSGSFYGKNVSVLGGGFVTVTYDRAILNQGNKCEQPVSCTKCQNCNGGTTCKDDGTCGACTDDSQCCTPLVCVQGSCKPLLLP